LSGLLLESSHAALGFHGVKTIEGSILRQRARSGAAVAGRAGPSPLVSLK
jgi:hypothetical protein